MIAREFTIPKTVKVDDKATDRYARILVEPFERGYGTTVGNSLRRVLLASLEGSAVTAIRIEGINHEFSAIPGYQEDVTDLVLNLKRAEVRLNRDEPLIFSFTHSGAGNITVKDLFKDQSVDVFNPDDILLTSSSKTASIEMEVKVARGRGYVTAEHFELEHAPLGTIYLDANFSPVTKVNFQVEDARVGQSIDYDRLILDIWTNGSISAQKALEEAAGLLIEHLSIFIQKDEQAADGGAGGAPEDPELARIFAKSVDELELSVRAANCLKAANILTIGDLISREEGEMLQFHNFGKKSLDEIKAILETMGLALGMRSRSGAVTAAPALVAVPSDDEEGDDELNNEEE